MLRIFLFILFPLTAHSENLAKFNADILKTLKKLEDIKTPKDFVNQRLEAELKQFSKLGAADMKIASADLVRLLHIYSIQSAADDTIEVEIVKEKWKKYFDATTANKIQDSLLTKEIYDLIKALWGRPRLTLSEVKAGFRYFAILPPKITPRFDRPLVMFECGFIKNWVDARTFNACLDEVSMSSKTWPAFLDPKEKAKLNAQILDFTLTSSNRKKFRSYIDFFVQNGEGSKLYPQYLFSIYERSLGNTTTAIARIQTIQKAMTEPLTKDLLLSSLFYYELGLNYAIKGDLEKAKAALANLRPKQIPARREHLLAVILAKEKKWKELNAILAKAEVFPNTMHHNGSLENETKKCLVTQLLANDYSNSCAGVVDPYLKRLGYLGVNNSTILRLKDVLNLISKSSRTPADLNEISSFQKTLNETFYPRVLSILLTQVIENRTKIVN